MSQTSAVQAVKQWLQHVVIGLNFCPFANQALVTNRVLFQACDATESQAILEAVLEELMYLEANPQVETTLVILTQAAELFPAYLKLLDQAEVMLEVHGYEGTFQIASFHPDYCFADTDVNDASNYTNRSPLPVFHLLREASLTEAIDNHPNIDGIPQRNIEVARGLGEGAMQDLLDSSQDRT